MKIRNVVVASMSVLLLASCEEAAPDLTVCDCMSVNLEMLKELGFEGMSDEAQVDAFRAAKVDTLDICDSISMEFGNEIEALSPDEQEARRKEFTESCPVIDEFQKVFEEMQAKAMEEAMKQMGGGDLEGLEGLELDPESEEMLEEIDGE